MLVNSSNINYKKLNNIKSKVSFYGSINQEPKEDTFECTKKKITIDDVENKVKRGYYLVNQTAALLTPYMQTLSETVVPATPLGSAISTFYGTLIAILAVNNHLFNKATERIDKNITETQEQCKKELSKEDFELAQRRNLFKPDYKKGYSTQFDKEDIKALVKLNDKEFEKAKTLFWIDKRDYCTQFSGEAIADLVKLPEDQYKKAESLFYLDKRDTYQQFTGEAIVEFAKLPDDIYKKAENLFYKNFKDKQGYDYPLNANQILTLCKADKQIEEAKKYNPIIKTEIENMLNNERIDVYGIITLAKSVDELKGGKYSETNDYTYAQSKLKAFFNEISTRGDEKWLTDYLKEDIEIEKNFGSAKVYAKNNPNSPVSKYFYALYLKDIENKVDKNVIEKCKNFYDKYNTQIYISLNKIDKNNISKIIDAIDEEFEKWKKAGNGKEKYPPIIDFNKADKNWYIYGGVFGDCPSGTAAYVEDATNALHFKMQDMRLIKQDLRHEITHINDLKNGKVEYSEKELEEIMPKHFNYITKGKYYDEFDKAGIRYEIIEYANHNPAEYIAVASEGDMTKYSDEFKKVLIKLGMPEWEFNLEK